MTQTPLFTQPLGELELSLRGRRDVGRKLFVPYVTGGIREDWLDLVRALAEAGADAIEIGIPFSDPMMDGPTIQQASTAALRRGATPQAVLSELRQVDAGVPLIAMTYYNLVYRAGHGRFCEWLAEGGVCAAIVPDLPLEESHGWEADAEASAIETVLLAAPVSPDDRLASICARSRGFVYGVGLMGVTGARDSVAASSLTLAHRLKAATDRPVLMGFGVSTPDQAVALAGAADGVIIASALMRRVLDGASAEEIGEQALILRTALDREFS